MRSVSARGRRHRLRLLAPPRHIVCSFPLRLIWFFAMFTYHSGMALFKRSSANFYHRSLTAEEWPPASAWLTATMFIYYFIFSLVVSLSCIELLRRKARGARRLAVRARRSVRLAAFVWRAIVTSLLCCRVTRWAWKPWSCWMNRAVSIQ